MKTTKSILVVLFVLLTAQIASAYYSPSTGRWLSRDPMGEPGFEVLRAANTLPRDESSDSLASARWIQRDAVTTKADIELYTFCQNISTGKIDKLGLECENPCAGMRTNPGQMGTVVCCNGGLYTCVFGPPFPGVNNAKAASIIAQCLYVHEALHTLYVKPCKKCGKYKAEFKRGTHDQSECDSLKGELSCLETSLDDCNGDADCRLEIIHWANDTYRQAAGLGKPGSGYCKNPPPKPPWWE